MNTSKENNTIEELATTVYDNGRRGNPLPGCDCIQCFGYCKYDQDAVTRARAKGYEEWQVAQAIAEYWGLSFEP